MTPEPFSAEQWMTAYEQQAVYNLTDTSCQTLTMQDLCQWDPEFLQDIQLDYGDISGSDAVKDRILKLYASGERENVTVTAGCVNANRHVMDALLEEGDHVIAFAPGYQQYTAYPRSLGCDVTEVDYDLEQVKAAIRPETKMLILSSPANPTGFQVTDW